MKNKREKQREREEEEEEVRERQRAIEENRMRSKEKVKKEVKESAITPCESISKTNCERIVILKGGKNNNNQNEDTLPTQKIKFISVKVLRSAQYLHDSELVCH